MKSNPDWIRWFYSSFLDNFSGFSLPIFVVNQTRPSNISNFVELRMNGPHINQINQNLWNIDVYLACLITIINDETDQFKIQRYNGELLSYFKRDIPMFRYGDGPNDDNSQICCFRLCPNKGETLRSLIYGQTQGATRTTLCTVEAHYETSIGFIYDGSD